MKFPSNWPISRFALPRKTPPKQTKQAPQSAETFLDLPPPSNRGFTPQTSENGKASGSRSSAPQLPILVQSPEGETGEALIKGLEKLGGEVAQTSCFDVTLNLLVTNSRDWGLLVLFLDETLDSDWINDSLPSLRTLLPHIPVLQISSERVSNLFGLEDLALCDVALKTPVSHSALKLALFQAQVNNRFHQLRQARNCR